MTQDVAQPSKTCLVNGHNMTLVINNSTAGIFIAENGKLSSQNVQDGSHDVFYYNITDNGEPNWLDEKLKQQIDWEKECKVDTTLRACFCSQFDCPCPEAKDKGCTTSCIIGCILLVIGVLLTVTCTTRTIITVKNNVDNKFNLDF